MWRVARPNHGNQEVNAAAKSSRGDSMDVDGASENPEILLEAVEFERRSVAKEELKQIVEQAFHSMPHPLSLILITSDFRGAVVGMASHPHMNSSRLSRQKR